MSNDMKTLKLTLCFPKGSNDAVAGLILEFTRDVVKNDLQPLLLSSGGPPVLKYLMGTVTIERG